MPLLVSDSNLRLRPSAAQLSDSGPTTGGVGAIATALPTQGTPSVSGGVAASSSSSPSPTGSSGAAQLTFNAVLGLAGLAAGYALLL